MLNQFFKRRLWIYRKLLIGKSFEKWNCTFFSDFSLPCFPSFGSWTFDLNLRLFSFAFEAVWWEDVLASAKSGPKWLFKNWRGSKSIRVGLSCSSSSSSSISKLSDVTGSGIVLNFLLLDKKTKAQNNHF